MNACARVGAAVLAACAPLLLLPFAAYAGEFGVSPTRLELGPNVRSAAFTIRNADQRPLSFQVRGMHWSQDEDGQDHYEEAGDLVYFPRVLTVEPGKEGVIRVGVRQALVPTEKTYRLFIEELPPAASDKAAATQISVLMRFGAPIFVRPPQPAFRVELNAAELQSGTLAWQLRNGGNTHARFQNLSLQGLDAGGAQVFSKPIEARYLLAGQTRRFSTHIPLEACERLQRLELLIKTDTSEMRQPLAVGTSSCQ